MRRKWGPKRAKLSETARRGDLQPRTVDATT
jgi:hypothetical protein